MMYKKYFFVLLFACAIGQLNAENDENDNKLSSEEQIRKAFEEKKKRYQEKIENFKKKQKKLEERLVGEEQERRVFIADLEEKEKMPEALALKRLKEERFFLSLLFVASGVNKNALEETLTEVKEEANQILKDKYIKLFGPNWGKLYQAMKIDKNKDGSWMSSSDWQAPDCIIINKKTQVDEKYDRAKEYAALEERYKKKELPKLENVFSQLVSEVGKLKESCCCDINSLEHPRDQERLKKRCGIFLENTCSKLEYEDIENLFVNKFTNLFRQEGFPVFREEVKNLFDIVSGRLDLKNIIKKKYNLCGLDQSEDFQ